LPFSISIGIGLATVVSAGLIPSVIKKTIVTLFGLKKEDY